MPDAKLLSIVCASALLVTPLCLAQETSPLQEDFEKFAETAEELKRFPSKERVEQAYVEAGQFLDRHLSAASAEQLTLVAEIWLHMALVRNQGEALRRRIAALRALPKLPPKLSDICTKTEEMLAKQEGLEAARQAVKPGKPAPAWSATDIADGTQVTLEGLRGKVVLMEFWATWCPPSLALRNQELAPLFERYRTDARFAFVAIGVPTNKESAAKQKEAAQQSGHAWRHVFDAPGRIATSYGAQGVPFLCLVDEAGKIIHVGTPQAVLADVKRTLQQRLGPGQDPARPASPAGAGPPPPSSGR